MSKAKIFVIFVLIDLAIVGGCVWSAFHRIPVRVFLVPAILLFSINGLWLVWITLKKTPPGE